MGKRGKTGDKRPIPQILVYPKEKFFGAFSASCFLCFLGQVTVSRVRGGDCKGPGWGGELQLQRCDSLHPSLAPCDVLLGDTPHPCETTGPKVETVHGSGPSVHARS